MNHQQIRLRPIFDLRLDPAGQPVRYFIPAYQRGYRWTPTQVIQLLEDVREFTRRPNPKPEEFYCLQPLVLLARADSSFEVVDGQQRLTTLLLVLRYFNERLAARYQQPLYVLEYATRPNLLSFLDDPTDERANSNIDFFHISEATKVIEAWFGERENEVEGIKDRFLNSVKVIWFELAPGENPVAAFTRLNVGKIPLTNAELIRALFLRSTPGEESEYRRLRIAYEWDLVEKTLQESAFWAFVSNDTSKTGGRIGFLFDLAARQHGMAPGPNEYQTFNHFSARLDNPTADPAEAWLEVKKLCMLLEEWFADRQLYHLVGFLIECGTDVIDLCKLAAGCGKSDFKQKVRSEVVRRAFGTSPAAGGDVSAWVSDQLEGLTYPRDRPRIRSILLLFNIATLLQNSQTNIRFNFESFKTERWDIEHVRSVASAELGSSNLQRDWLENTLQYLSHIEQEDDVVELKGAIQAHLSLPTNERMLVFESLYSEVLKFFHEDDGGEPDNSISNLALLDEGTNRSYKNAVFPVKRQRLIERDRHGVFVPHCTRNVFLKSYSPQVGHAVYWTDQDRDGYRQNLVATLSEFIGGGSNHV